MTQTLYAHMNKRKKKDYIIFIGVILSWLATNHCQTVSYITILVANINSQITFYTSQ
jgi:uncharacterized membrane protein YobD (UPF0266 family)